MTSWLEKNYIVHVDPNGDTETHHAVKLEDTTTHARTCHDEVAMFAVDCLLVAVVCRPREVGGGGVESDAL